MLRWMGLFVKVFLVSHLWHAVSVTQYSNTQRTCNTFPNSNVSEEDLAAVSEASTSHIKVLVLVDRISQILYSL